MQLLSSLCLGCTLLNYVRGTPLGDQHGFHGGNLQVKTNLFTVQGSVFPNATDVRFFGNIPYAEPPLNELRFRPPQSVKPRNEPVNGTWFGPACIQPASETSSQTVYSLYLPGYLLAPGLPTSEDCLTLNVWAPKESKERDNLPVMIWVHGGGLTQGGAAEPYKYGHKIAEQQNVIVVSINYRLNIFGFPNAAALDGHNLNPGLLDQRKAVEWVYSNIHAFGGDARKMTLFGQSSGAMAVDAYTYTYSSDPLVRGIIAQSGSVQGVEYINDPSGSNFTYIASKLGCSINGTETDDEVFACMQTKPATDIIGVANTYNSILNDNKTLGFTATVDNEVVFANYTDLQQRGLFAKIPSIYSNNDNEAASLVPFKPTGYPQQLLDAQTKTFTCSSANAAGARHKAGLPVWRTRYSGNWTNLDPFDWLGAYHGSDLPMLFGTYGYQGRSEREEEATSGYYQDVFVAFVKDPLNGPLAEFGWPKYEPDAQTLVRLGNRTVNATFVKGNLFDAGCANDTSVVSGGGGGGDA